MIDHRTLKHIRTARGYSQEEIAHMLGISKSYYGFFEQGRRTIPSSIKIKLKNLFHIKEEDIRALNEAIRTLH